MISRRFVSVSRQTRGARGDGSLGRKIISVITQRGKSRERELAAGCAARTGGCGWFVSALHVMDYSDQWKVDQSADWLDKFRRCNRTATRVPDTSACLSSIFPRKFSHSLSLSLFLSIYLSFSFPRRRSSFIYSCRPYPPTTRATRSAIFAGQKRAAEVRSHEGEEIKVATKGWNF